MPEPVSVAILGGASGVLSSEVIDKISESTSEDALKKIEYRLRCIEATLKTPDRVNWGSTFVGEFSSTYNAGTLVSEDPFVPESSFLPSANLIVTTVGGVATVALWQLFIGSHSRFWQIGGQTTTSVALLQEIINGGVPIYLRPGAGNAFTGTIYGYILGYYQGNYRNPIDMASKP